MRRDRLGSIDNVHLLVVLLLLPSFNLFSVGGAIFMALEGPEELEICRQMQEEIKERLQESLFQWKFFF